MAVTYDMSTGYIIKGVDQQTDVAEAEQALYRAEHDLQLLPVGHTEEETTDAHPAVIAAALHHIRQRD